MTENIEQIAQRYGKSTEQLSRRRRSVKLLAALFAALFVVWGIWVNLTASTNPVFKTTAYEIINDQEITVTFVVTKPGNKTAICAVQALKADYGIVGYKEVRIEGDKSLQGTLLDYPVKVTLKTTEPSVTGVVDHCWLD